jgi:sugar phosphate isomerase/epimerase
MYRVGFSEYSANTKAIDAAAKCVRLGLTSYQITGDFQLNFPENIDKNEREQIREFNTEQGIALHYHAPTDIPLASRHHHLRLSGVERLIEYLELAIDLGARSFIFHPGRFAFYKISSGKVVLAQRDIPDIYFERFYDSVKRLVNYTAGRINLLLENTYNFSKQLIGIVDRFLELPSTGLVWDIGHMHHKKSTGLNRESSTAQIAEFFSDRLKHIKLAHIHDVAGVKGHLALGAGEIKLAPYIDIINTLGIDMIVEVFSEQDLQTSIEYINRLSTPK